MDKLIDSDFSFLESSSCYCSEQSANTMRTLIADIELNSIHYIGTGDYHYISLFYLERIKEDFTLVLIDNHSDDQKGLVDLLSCGSWVADARTIPHCKGDLWISSSLSGDFSQESDLLVRNGSSSLRGFPLSLRDFPSSLRATSLRSGVATEHCLQCESERKRTAIGSAEIPYQSIYLSIDLDVLDPKYAHTNWSQGTMTLEELLSIINYLKTNYKILGVDICGGLSENKGGTPEDWELNKETISRIVNLLNSNQ